jgi:hypothetical protein
MPDRHGGEASRAVTPDRPELPGPIGTRDRGRRTVRCLPSRSVTDVYLHVGLPKTGTTSIQRALTEHASDLAAVGVLVPGGRHIEQRRAAYDLLGHRLPGDDREITGAFERVTAEMRAYGGRTIVFSDETLSRARPRQAQRMVAALAGHRVFVVVTVRDLARMMTSAWQQSVVMGSQVDWPEFQRCVCHPDQGSVSVSAKFWLRHDLTRTLDVWGRVVPADRVTVVTVPPPGAGSNVLFERFGEAIGVPAALWSGGHDTHNVGPGAVGIEVLLRLNRLVGDELTGMPHRWTVEDGILRTWHPEHSDPPGLSHDDLTWVHERSQRLIADVAGRGHRVVGDLADLVPVGGLGSSPPVTEAMILASTEQALASLAVAYGDLRTRYRRLARRRPPPPGRVTAVRSAVRSTSSRAMRSALERSDRIPPLAWLVRRYLAR